MPRHETACNPPRGMALLGETNGSVRLQRSAFKKSGSCTNSRKIIRGAIEAAVFTCLREEPIRRRPPHT